jgi:hypothetical protein
LDHINSQNIQIQAALAEISTAAAKK